MKLIHVSTRNFLVYSLFIFIIGTYWSYSSTQKILFNSIDEALYQEKIQLIENLKYEEVIEKLRPSKNVIIAVSSEYKINDKLPKDAYTVVSIKDSTTNTYTDFRQLTSYHIDENDVYKITIKQSISKAEGLINSIIPEHIILFFLLISGTFLINYLIDKTTLQPFYQLLDRLKNFDIHAQKTLKSEHTHIEEFNQLNLLIEKMTEKIYSDYLAQREFIENSSHEYQTPIAIIKNNLDLLVQSPTLTEEEMDKISSIYQAIRRLTALNKGLLLLYKIENNQFIESESINLNVLIHRIFDSLSESINTKNISLQIDIDEHAYVLMNQALAEVLLTNLLSNALRHNIQSGFIKVDYKDKILIIKNSGKPLESSAERMFERFSKSGNSEGSIGLGLAIAKKICEKYRFDIKYFNIDTTHTFVIVF